MPAISSDRRKRARGMLARRPVTGATSDTQFGDFRFPRFVDPIEVRLGLHVVAKDTVRIPFGGVLFVIAPVGEKERSVEVHPAALHEIVGDGQAKPGIALLRQILLDPAECFVCSTSCAGFANCSWH